VSKKAIYRLTRNRPNGEVQSFDYDRSRDAGNAVFHSLLDNGYVRERKEATRLAYQAETTGEVVVDGHWYRIERVHP